ncbi:ABC transporter permease [Vibrio algarum]|uniref:ABC transporter permease subunit n=1 Tax=Vibrio algarum TaxID=3020714 RepID=A0ABT4YPK7_9VIBR|nr:ABC transporter permease subunit [Vibrio sp. KJ40-1]MDB1123485.1 ABC transporter permease subunit [Vibrio sp. KJ40-1]
MVNYKSMSWYELLAIPLPDGGYLLDGLFVSLQVASLGYVLGLIIGMFAANAKRRGSLFVADLVTIYTTLIRSVPELVLILLVYFALPELINQLLSFFGAERIEIDKFAAGVLVITIVQGAYATEVIRGAMNAIPKGHIEAAESFGMHPFVTFYRITIPEMLPNALPGLSNLWLIATKDTALLAVVGFTELTLAARQAAGATKSYFLFLFAAGLLYLIVTLVSNIVFGYLEKRLNRGVKHA